jgi:hypothetical protein
VVPAHSPRGAGLGWQGNPSPAEKDLVVPCCPRDAALPGTR